MPYVNEINRSIQQYLEASCGFSVENMHGFDFDDEQEIGYLFPSEIIDAVIELDHEEAEGIFISCTALRATQTIRAIELRLNKPVITSNQALLWDALRLAGYDGTIENHGRLMKIPSDHSLWGT
uniref:Maleate isomerase n=1 Tax=Candidatus Kentrum sp. MB TaxID=2138164 RepID=A0A451BEW3_9GAMM|nr:MAG: maleate isomerase [Candidatus Kentron sp. MB]VFK76809.1 MAG: maleate isomerase [Candidatus Kentron sp. MB]